MSRVSVVVCFLMMQLFINAQQSSNMETKITSINMKLFPTLTVENWNIIKTAKAFYLVDTLDATKTTLNIIISNAVILNTTLNSEFLINTCKPNTQILKIELKNKSGNAIEIGNYKYDGSDTKPLDGLPKIELIAKPMLSILPSKQSKNYSFEISKEHRCVLISVDENYVIGSFYFKDTEGIISGQFKAEIIKLIN